MWDPPLRVRPSQMRQLWTKPLPGVLLSDPPIVPVLRVAAFTDWVASEVLEPVSHRQVVFTVPKVLRPVFRKNRKLLGLLCRCAWETLKEMHQGAFPEGDVRGTAVIAVQTAGDQLQWHPHLHALVADAVWGRDAMTRIFQAKVLRMLVDERCLSREFAARLLTWRHSGFQVYRPNPWNLTTGRRWSACAPTSAAPSSPPAGSNTTRPPALSIIRRPRAPSSTWTPWSGSPW